MVEAVSKARSRGGYSARVTEYVRGRTRRRRVAAVASAYKYRAYARAEAVTDEILSKKKKEKGDDDVVLGEYVPAGAARSRRKRDSSVSAAYICATLRSISQQG